MIRPLVEWRKRYDSSHKAGTVVRARHARAGARAGGRAGRHDWRKIGKRHERVVGLLFAGYCMFIYFGSDVFTNLHMGISPIGIVSGPVATFGLMAGRRGEEPGR
jgi:hypothetical protein